MKVKSKTKNGPAARKRNGRPAVGTYAFPVVIEKDNDGYFAVCPSLQGCYTQGDTYEEIVRNIREAIELHVESRLERGEDIPRYDIHRVIAVEVKI